MCPLRLRRMESLSGFLRFGGTQWLGDGLSGERGTLRRSFLLAGPELDSSRVRFKPGRGYVEEGICAEPVLL